MLCTTMKWTATVTILVACENGHKTANVEYGLIENARTRFKIHNEVSAVTVVFKPKVIGGYYVCMVFLFNSYKKS